MKRRTVRPGLACRCVASRRLRAACLAIRAHRPRRVRGPWTPHSRTAPMETNMNKRTDARMLTEGLHPLDIDALVEARHPDPFSKLGLHQTDAGPVVRVLLPGASGVQVLERDSGKPLGTLTQIHPAGLFAGFIDEMQAYRLNIDWHGTPQEVADTYSFGPVLSDEALNRVSGGDPYAVMECLGSRPVVHGGVAGVRFAVWAPNARRVSVVGDFHSWDGRVHPMRSCGGSGVWEIFLPELASGVTYKYEIRSRLGALPFLKADPYAFEAELRPKSGSVVSTLEGYGWGGEPWMKGRGRREWLAEPVSIYEVHLGSWRRVAEEGNRWLTYRELADQLIPYVKQ